MLDAADWVNLAAATFLRRTARYFHRNLNLNRRAAFLPLTLFPFQFAHVPDWKTTRKSMGMRKEEFEYPVNFGLN